MKKIIFVLLAFVIYSTPVFAKKIFKSKNGYSITLPKSHDVIEKNVTKFVKGKDTTQTLDQNMFEESIKLSKKYATWITDRAENPLFYNMTVTVVDALFNIGDFNKDWCPEFEAYYDQMFVNKKINFYVCKKQNLKINNIDTEVLKLKYDNPRPGILTYQYSFETKNVHMNFAGSCKKNKCNALDQNLKDIVSSFSWN